MRRLFQKLGTLLFACALQLAAEGAEANGAEPTRRFNEANVLFETGKYAEAAAAYEALVRTGKTSAALYFNLGTAHLKAGQLGRAIFYLRQSQKLAPRESDIRTNLHFAREKAANGRPVKMQLGRSLTDWLTLDEWAVLGTLTLWLVLGLLTVNRIRPEWRNRIRPWLVPVGATAALLLTLSCIAWSQQTRREAVLIVAEAIVRYGPLEESQAAHTLTDGVEVRVLDEQEGWVRVADADGREGWLPTAQVASLGTRH